MVFVDIATEQTTAITDLINFFLCIILAISIYRAGHSKDLGRSRYWTMIYLLLALSGFIGAIAHGIEMPDNINRIVWMPLSLALGLTISLFLALVILELKGPELAKKLLPYMIGIGIFFFLITVLFPGIFLLFILFESFAMIFAFAAFVYLSKNRDDRFYKLVIGIISAVIFFSIGFGLIHVIGAQTYTLIWEFDQNSLFHIVQSIAMIILAIGIRDQLKRTRLRTGRKVHQKRWNRHSVERIECVDKKST